MSQVIRTVQNMTPSTPYAELLKRDFGVEVPETAPKYQQEYLYKYALQLTADPDVSEDEIIALAAIKAEELVTRNPWYLLKYEEVIASGEKETKRRTAKVKTEYADGTIVYNSGPGTHHGVHFYYLGGKIAARSKKIEKLYALIEKKLGKKVPINKKVVTVD
jgi:hypothetical protein